MNLSTLFGVHSKKRLFWEVDVFRGIALILMIAFHFTWDLFYFNLISTHPRDIFGSVISQGAYFFLFLVGVSIFLSVDAGKKFNFFVKRGLLIFGWGVLISLLVYFFINELILFGILNLIGLSIIIGYFLSKNRWFCLFGGFFCFLFGWFLNSFSSESLFLSWLGVDMVGVSFVDHFPVFPWLGWVLLGCFVGGLLYSGKKRLFKLEDYSGVFPLNFLGLFGRNSLFIYLVHQPILLFLLWVIVLIIF